MPLHHEMVRKIYGSGHRYRRRPAPEGQTGGRHHHRYDRPGRESSGVAQSFPAHRDWSQAALCGSSDHGRQAAGPRWSGAAGFRGSENASMTMESPRNSGVLPTWSSIEDADIV
jgi:hypothetical protein